MQSRSISLICKHTSPIYNYSTLVGVGETSSILNAKLLHHSISFSKMKGIFQQPTPPLTLPQEGGRYVLLV
jgi:hypothetical protein